MTAIGALSFLNSPHCPRVLVMPSFDSSAHLRANQFDLLKQPAIASNHLVWFRVAVTGWSAFDDVADEHARPWNACCTDDLIQQLPAAPDERSPSAILVLTGPLANNHQLRV